MVSYRFDNDFGIKWTDTSRFFEIHLGIFVTWEDLRRNAAGPAVCMEGDTSSKPAILLR